MASELRVNTLKDASGNNSIATSFVAGGSAKAWANYAGTGTTLRDSLNCSSATDHSTGNYTITFSSALSDTNYSTSESHEYAFDGNSNATFAGVDSMTTTTYRQTFTNYLGTHYDHTYVSIHAMGDLA